MSQGKISAIFDEKTQKIIVQRSLPTLVWLALEGGGVRGAAYSGLAKILKKYGLLAELKYISGSSVGAIAALILALGYSPEEGEKILCNLPIDEFLEGANLQSKMPDSLTKWIQVLTILMSKEHYLSSGKKFLTWLEDLVEEKLHNRKATFRDLACAIAKEKENNLAPSFKELFVTATNLSLPVAECDYFSSRTMSEAPLALAVLASASFPTVFKAVEWNGFTYADGGLKNNLPADIFDDEESFPECKLTKQGKNPFVLVVKIDSDQEIMQLYGKEKANIDAVTASLKALTETSNMKEIREKRMVIALSDTDIQTLQFSINAQGRVKLISSAEKVTQEFFENHMDEASFVKEYSDVKSWLMATKSLDELKEIIEAYREMKRSISALDEKKQAAFPSLKEIDEYIEFLKKYMYSRINNDETFVFQKKHVNLISMQSEDHWNKRIKKEMEDKLENVKNQIYLIKYKLKNISLEENLNGSDKLKLHEEPLYSNMKQFFAYQEYLRLLKKEKFELKIKLNIQNKKPVYYESAKFETFCRYMRPLFLNKEISFLLSSILKCVNLYSPQIIYPSAIENDNIFFQLDLRNSYDQKIFLSAVYLYLEYRKSKDQILIKELYSSLFLIESPPQQWHALSLSLKQQGSSLLISAYRIEELLHFFERIEFPNRSPTIDIDCLFGASTYSIFNIKVRDNKKNNNKHEVELKSIFHPSQSFFLGSAKNKHDFKVNSLPLRDTLTNSNRK